MLAWEVFLHRQLPGESFQNLPKETLLAHWIESITGLDWLDELVSQRRAAILPNHGYPQLYIALASDVLPRVPYDSKDSRTGIFKERIDQCSANELVILEAWDQS